MDAWEQLISGSTIQDGDAWEHLLAQGGGTGTIDYLVLADGIGLDVDNDDVMIAVDDTEIAVLVDQSEMSVAVDFLDIAVAVENTEIEVVITDGN